MPGSSRLAVSLPKFRTKHDVRRADVGNAFYYRAFDVLRNLLLLFYLLRITNRAWIQIRGYGVLGSLRQLWTNIYKRAYAIFLRMPVVRDRVKADVDKAIKSLELSLVSSGPGVESFTVLPRQGYSKEKVHEELEKLASMKHTHWEDGKVSGAVYHGGSDLSDLQSEAFRKFGVANPIHPDVFPGVRKMEAEVVAMTLRLFNAPQGGAGVTTSGGTESILMAVLAARTKAYQERNVRHPEMILPETAHTAFRKAADYFKIRLHLVPCPAPSHRVSIAHVQRLINSNTILLVGSAPNFPHGIVDSIPDLSRLAVKHKLPLHVDCCLGSFIMPMLRKAGFEEPYDGTWDFRAPGVTSISVDTHKYGFAPKGNSCVLYRSRAMRACQYYICPDWSGGVYASPSMAGSRPGALIAGCWASLMMMGEEGYVDACLKIVTARERIEAAIREREGLSSSLQIIGRPMASVVAFRAPPEDEAPSPFSGLRLDIYDVADGMSRRGWHLNALQDPPAMHVAVTLPIVAAVDTLISDLEAVVAECKGKSDGKKGDTAALYGVAGAMPEKSVVTELAAGFLDTLYKT